LAKGEIQENGDMATPRNRILIFIGIFLAVIILWILFAFLIFFQANSLQDSAKLGDAFGSLNTLFSGLAFAAIIFTIILQMEELRLQREELKDTRKVLAKSAKAHQELKKTQDFHNQILITDILIKYYENLGDPAQSNLRNRISSDVYALNYAILNEEMKIQFEEKYKLKDRLKNDPLISKKVREHLESFDKKQSP